MGTNHAQDFDLNFDLHSIDVDDVAPPTIKLSDVTHHASLLSNFLLALFVGQRLCIDFYVQEQISKPICGHTWMLFVFSIFGPLYLM